MKSGACSHLVPFALEINLGGFTESNNFTEKNSIIENRNYPRIAD